MHRTDGMAWHVVVQVRCGLVRCVSIIILLLTQRSSHLPLCPHKANTTTTNSTQHNTNQHHNSILTHHDHEPLEIS